MNVDSLQPRHHEPPSGWDEQTFASVTDAIAAALVAAVRRADVKNQPIEPESCADHADATT